MLWRIRIPGFPWNLRQGVFPGTKIRDVKFIYENIEYPIMTHSRWLSLRCGMVCSVILLLAVAFPVSGASDTNASGSTFQYQVQEDPFFIFAYPQGMTLTITSANARNSYRLVNDDKVSYAFSSAENEEWAPLKEAALADFEKTALATLTGNDSTRNITAGKPVFSSDANLSSYFTSYLDNDKKELIYVQILSTNQSVISGILVEPTSLYKTPFGDFTLKSLLSVSPRDMEKSFTLDRVGTDKSMGEKSNTTVANETAEKAIAYDPYAGLYYDTDTGYYYLPYYGVFYDPNTGDYYYPQEFGNYGTNYFPDYTGTYDPYGLNTGGYYNGLYGGYGGTAGGYDATGIIQSVVDYRQSVMDASNDAWDAYIRE